MKFKTTKKAMKENYSTIIGIGYCNAQHLLNFEEPIAYSTRAEGWACDYYVVNNVLISTGYAPIDGIRNYALVREYDQKAEKIQYNYDKSYEERKTEIHDLLVEFVTAAISIN
jgi:hypothetical protein